jgi:hypothetical protein
MYDPHQKQHRLSRLMPNALVVCHPLLTFPTIVCRPILHAVIIRCRCLPPLPLSSAAAVFHCHHLCCSHHHHSTVSAVSCRPISSFPIIVRRPILQAIVIRHRCHPPSLSSAVSVVVCHRHLPPLQPSLPLHCIWHHLPLLSLPHCSPPPNLACLCCPPPQSSSAPVVVCHRPLCLPTPSSIAAAIIATPPSPPWRRLHCRHRHVIFLKK